MPCSHKFQNDLYLQGLDYEPTTLIVGTFNPAWIEDNEAQWFYGRTNADGGNNFWEVLPKLYNEPNLRAATPTEWKEFCRKYLIAITDLFETIDDANMEDQQHVEWLSDYSDKNIATKFVEHVPVHIPEILQWHPSILNVYFTRGVAETFWRRKWQPVKSYCQQNRIRCRTLITPSHYAWYQQARHNNQNQNNKLNLPDYILMRWREVWHPLNEGN